METQPGTAIGGKSLTDARPELRQHDIGIQVKAVRAGRQVGSALPRVLAALNLNGVSLLLGSVAVHIVALGSPGFAQNGPDVGCLQARLSPVDLTLGTQFGAAMALDGDTLVVTAPRSPNGLPLWVAYGSRAYVYRRVGLDWIQEAKLLGAQIDDGFGLSVAILGDTMAVGAPRASDFGPFSGAVFVFTRTGTLWTQQARLLANDGASGDGFGASVALEQDRLAIGALEDDDQGTASGSAYVFERSGQTWLQTAKLLANNGSPLNLFGMQIETYGDHVFVGAYAQSTGGAVYVFRSSGGIWAQDATLTSVGYFSSGFGGSIAADAARVVIGVPGWGTFGSAQIFRRSSGGWGHEATLWPSDFTVDDAFGSSVSLFNDRILIGATGVKEVPWGPPRGAAYVFENTSGSWNQVAKLKHHSTSPIGAMGSTVALDSTELFVADRYDSEVSFEAGTAYIFKLVQAYSVYCTAKTNSQGCIPAIAAQGVGSANAAQGLVISCAQVRNDTLGLLMYSVAGRNNLPFQGGLLCVNPPIHRRTPGLSSGGSPPPTQDCSGVFSIDMNAFARGALGGHAIAELSVIGTVVQCQWWGRDQGFLPPFNSMLSDAVEYTICQ